MNSASEWRRQLDRSLILKCAMSAARFGAPLLRAYGVDRARFLALLEVRLTQDLVGKTGLHSDRGRGTSLGAILAVIFFILAGLGVGVMPLAKVEPAIFAGGASALLMALLSFVFLMQFAAIFVDPTDLDVLSPLPIESRTIFAARIAHAMTYLVILGGAFASFSTLFACIGYKSFMPLLAWPFVVLCSTMLTLGFIALVHGLLLYFVGPRHFQRVTFWVQLGLTAFFVGAGQWLQVIVPVGTLVSAVQERDAWLAALPPVQMSGLFSFMMGSGGTWNGGLALLALSLPIGFGWLTLRLASRDFAAAVGGEFSRAESGRLGDSNEQWFGGRARRFFSRFLFRRPESQGLERAGFVAGWALCVRDRIFIRSTVPSIAATTFPVFATTITLRRVDFEMADLLPVLSLYILSISIPTAAEALRFSEQPRANWVLRSMPFERPGAYVRGALFAVLVRWMLPLAIALVALQFLLLGPSALYDVPLSLGLGSLLGTLAVAPMRVGLPFTHQPSYSDFDVTNLPVIFMIVVWTLIAAIFHSALWYFGVPGPVRMAIGLLPWFFFGRAFRTWDKIRIRPLQDVRP